MQPPSNFLEFLEFPQSFRFGWFIWFVWFGWFIGFNEFQEKTLSLSPMYVRRVIAEALKRRNKGIPLGNQKINQAIEK
jgi:hypothetical protein